MFQYDKFSGSFEEAVPVDRRQAICNWFSTERMTNSDDFRFKSPITRPEDLTGTAEEGGGGLAQ